MIKPVNPKGNQFWTFIGRTDAEPEDPILCYLMRRTDSLEKSLMKIEGRRRGWEDEMVGWHRWLNGHEVEQAPGVGDGQGSLVCCSPWGHKDLDIQFSHSVVSDSRWLGEILTIPNMQIIPPTGRKWRGTKDGERGKWKAGLKFNVQKTKIMASSPIILWQLEGEKIEAVGRFYFLGL